jgi:hypothetical protein
MKNAAGKAFLIANPNSVKTNIISPGIHNLLQELKNDAVIVTNSPEDYALAMMKKHNLPNVSVFGSASKPCSHLRLDKNSIFIGDEPLDALFAHEQKIPSIIITEGSFFPEAQINKAQPNAIAKNSSELENILSQNLSYVPFKIENHVILNRLNSTDIPVHHIRDYYRWGSPKFDLSGSRIILAYKKVKEHSWEEIQKNQTDAYYYNGRIKSGAVLLPSVNLLYNQIIDKIKSLDLKGSTRVIGLPNSLPEYAYLTDLNYRIAYLLNDKSPGRNIYRLKPVPEAHTTGIRGGNKNIGTLGILVNSADPAYNLDLSVDNIILLDDVITTGTAMRCTASLLRDIGYQKNIVGLAIAKTVLE